jgi:hypothetical protein
MAQVKYAGTKINLGGDDYIVPALSIGQAESFAGDIETINKEAGGGSVNFALFSKWMPIYTAAIQRNYPALTEETMKSDLIDLSNHSQVQRAVLGLDKDNLTRGE